MRDQKALDQGALVQKAPEKGRMARAMGGHDPAIVQQAEATLVHIRALWRELFRNPLAEAAEAGVTGPQVTVMSFLVTRGPLTLTELSRLIGMSHSTASGIVDRLEARGLVLRTPDPKDQRRTSITVTDKVAQYVRELAGGPSGRLAAALAHATPEQRRAIADGLEALREVLDQPAAVR
jgi:DNA-binding MarR family transcriptional regulator